MQIMLRPYSVSLYVCVYWEAEKKVLFTYKPGTIETWSFVTNVAMQEKCIENRILKDQIIGKLIIVVNL